MDTKSQDVLATLKLYEIRRDEKMREARVWFITEFTPQSAREILGILLSGMKESAHYRMVASYWDMSASFVNYGGIDEKLFLEANTEHVVVYAKLQPFLEEIRATIGEPDYLAHLERLVLKVPNIDKKLENRRQMLARWAQAARPQSEGRDWRARELATTCLYSS